MFNSSSSKVIQQCFVYEFTSSIWLKHWNFLFILVLYLKLERFENITNIRLCFKRIEPTEPWTIVNEHYIETKTLNRNNRRWTPNITVYSFKDSTRPKLWIWKGEATCLAKLKWFTNWLRSLIEGDGFYWRKMLQDLIIRMPQPLVPHILTRTLLSWWVESREPRISSRYSPLILFPWLRTLLVALSLTYTFVASNVNSQG